MPLEGSPSPLSRSTHPYTFGGTAANHNHNPADPHHAHHHAHHHHHAAAAAPAAAAPATVPQLEADALRLSKEAQLQERLREQLTEDLSAPASPLPHLLGAADARSDNGSDVAANHSASADSLVADHAAASSSAAVDTSMVVWADDELGNRQGDMTARQRDYLDAHRPLGDVPCPCLVLDLDVIRRNYEVLAASMPARVFYAVKANPAPALLEALAELGSCFDVASPGEIDCVLRAGVTPDRISYGNTIKKQADIAYAYRAGVRMYAFDSSAELQKLAAAAPGSRVYCRVLVPCDGAEWPLSRKFGCEPEMAEDLLVEAARAGLVPCGVSFHVGSQQCDPTAWRSALATVARVFRNVRARGLDTVRLVNLGGGMPSRYTRDVPAVAAYTANIRRALEDLFGPAEGGMPELIFEPGRSVAGDAGVIEAEVVLISRKSHGAGERRWVYLDIGLFGGLAETMGEAIRYRVRVPPGRSRVCAPVVLAGPTCDSADIMYDKTPFNLPVDLQVGDRIQILATGAYTTTYSSVCFNGFAPLACRTI